MNSDEQKLKKLIAKELNPILRNMANYIRTGRVTAVNTTSNRVDVKVSGQKEILKGVQYQRGANSDDVLVNSTCLLISQDPNLPGQVFAIVF